MDLFVARQPIFDRRRRVFAYELLFRSWPEGGLRCPANVPRPDMTISRLSVSTLTNGRPALVGLTREALSANLPLVLSPEDVVLLLPPLPADADVRTACMRLKAAGFKLALDRPSRPGGNGSLLPLADYVIARDIETDEMLGRAADEGCDYFHGRFYCRPATHGPAPIPGCRLGYLRLVEALSRPSSVDRLERIVKQEASIVFRLLRRANAVAPAERAEPRSLRDRFVRLGEHEIRSCAMVWLLAAIGEESPAETVVASALRARACELVAAQCDGRVSPAHAFVTGLLSLLDAIMERPMEQVIAELDVPEGIREALLGETSGLKTVLDCVAAYERGDWSDAVEFGRAVGAGERALASAYLDALRWADELTEVTGGD